MLNYIKAELWKVSRRGNFYLVMGILLFLTHLFGFIYSGSSFPALAAGVCDTMITGFVAVPALTQLVDSGFGETLRNEVSFGLRREEIYLGKLFSGILLGLALCAVLVGGVLVSGWLFLPHGGIREELTALVILGFCLTAALPVWCGMLGLCHMLATVIRSQSVWITLYFTGFFFGQSVVAGVLLLLTGGRVDLSTPGAAQSVLMPWTLLLSDHLSGQMTPRFLGLCWMVGTGWLAVTSAAGLLALRRRDIR